MSEHFRKLERMYHDHAPINDFFDPDLTIEAGRATLELPVSEKLHHPAGGVHGTAYFKALDDAAFFAVNSLVEDVFVLTTQLNLHLTRSGRSSTSTPRSTSARPSCETRTVTTSRARPEPSRTARSN